MWLLLDVKTEFLPSYHDQFWPRSLWWGFHPVCWVLAIKINNKIHYNFNCFQYSISAFLFSWSKQVSWILYLLLIFTNSHYSFKRTETKLDLSNRSGHESQWSSNNTAELANVPLMQRWTIISFWNFKGFLCPSRTLINFNPFTIMYNTHSSCLCKDRRTYVLYA